MAGAALLLLATPALAQTPWDARQYNPQPAPDDVILPMPCGGRMALRVVETPAGSSPLDDRPVVLGFANPETDYAEFVRQEFLAGGFTDKRNKSRYYLMGKYEVTQDQLASVMKSPCAAPSNQGKLPAANLSWFEAVEFTRSWSTWLLKNAPAALPAEGEVKGYVRLPTETEWEYAARGGAAVPEAEFLAKTFPMPEGPAKYAWFQGSRSAGGQARAIGLLQPNPLGLHDMLGNIAELVLEPYRLNRVGREHGQAGGFIAKGGDFRTPEDRLRTAQRIELAPFDSASGEPTRLPTVGFRVVVAATVTTSVQRADALREAFEASRSERAQAADPVKALEAIARDQPDPATAQALKRVAEALQAETRARLDQRRQTVKTQLETASLLIRSMREQDARLKALQAIVASTPDTPDNAARLKEYRQTVENNRKVLDITAQSYFKLLREISAADAGMVREQLAILEAENQNLGRPAFTVFDRRAAEQARRLAANPGLAPEALRAEILRD